MNIQLALDRLSINEAVKITEEVRPYVNWIEVGTSLIKEFGMESVRTLRKSFPEKVIIADMKTFDNAQYEFQMCYDAGADVATVMGAAPIVSIETCMNIAEKSGKLLMIDLLNTSKDKLAKLAKYESAIFCLHVSKDMQELEGTKQNSKINIPDELRNVKNLKLAIAGGITIDSLKDLVIDNPHVVIIGSAITKAKNPREVAKIANDLVNSVKGGD